MAYARAHPLISQEPILQVRSAENPGGRVISWACDFAVERLIKTGQWPFDYAIEKVREANRTLPESKVEPLRVHQPSS